MSDVSLSDWDKPQLLPHHQQEWLDSCVASEIIEANVQSLSGEDAIQTILYAFLDKQGAHAKHYVTTALDKQLKHYEAIVSGRGGWRVAGLDPLNNWERMEWGRFKPDAPRIEVKDGKEKPVKYESPLKTPTRATFLALPNQPDFWQQVLDTNAPIYLTEGEKKAGCLLSLGYAAIALPGIWNGCPRGDFGIPRLIPELECFATSGRPVVIVFDQDEKEKTRQDVAKAQHRLGSLLEQRGCQVTATEWDVSLGKGIDDVCVSRGSACVRGILSTTTAIRDPSILKTPQQDNSHSDGSVMTDKPKLKLRELISENSQATLNDGSRFSPRRASKYSPEEWSLFCLLRDAHGCRNWAEKNGFEALGSPLELAKEATEKLKLSSETVERINRQLEPHDRHTPNSVFEDKSEVSTWMKAARLNYSAFTALCPDHLQSKVREQLEKHSPSTGWTRPEEPIKETPMDHSSADEQARPRVPEAPSKQSDPPSPSTEPNRRHSPPGIDVIVEEMEPKKERDLQQDYWNQELAKTGRQLLLVADCERLPAGKRFEFDAADETLNREAQYVVVFNETTNTMRIYDKNRGENWKTNPILVDANGKIAEGSSAKPEDVQAFRAAIEALKSQQRAKATIDR